MTIDSINASVQEGSPIHLFEFLMDGQYYRYTNHPDDVEALTYTWTAAKITFGQVTVTEDINKNSLDVVFPRNHSFAISASSEQQDDIITLTVYRGYQNDGEWIAFWKGRVSGNQMKGDKITLLCEPVFTSMKRPGIRRKFTKHCPHVLYGRGCNLDPSDSASDALYVEATVDAISADGKTLTIEETSETTDNYYRGGMVMVASGVFRFVRSNVGTLVTLSKSYDALSVSDTVRLYPGCDRTTTTCLNRFNNLNNYGGFPYTPNNHPMDGSRFL